MSRFGITLGDPCGIGVEVTLKALQAKQEYQKDALLFGTFSLLEYYAKRLGYAMHFHQILSIEEWDDKAINVYDPLPVVR
ncbi:MAG: 4-phospho-D-threonate 3-dehydrogenase, partial [Spirochaetia bacterium]|nr:4-phospho-D-threonate 3-dehydrogenase [Spirochaetia bacterium]